MPPRTNGTSLEGLGERLAALRRRRGWSQRQLAQAAGVSHGYVALLESGKVPRPGKFRLDAVARALDLRSADALLGGDVEAEDPLPNVLGVVDSLRERGTRLLPVYRWGSCGDPRDREAPPDPDHLDHPPLGRETLIGPNGFGVMVQGNSMAARGIYDGDTVWVNPDRPYQVGKVVLALVVPDIGGEASMVVKTYGRTEVGDCLLSETDEGRSPVVCEEFKVIGPVVGITSWRLPT